MTVNNQIDLENNLIVRTISGELTLPDILAAFNDSLTDEDFSKDMNVIWNFNDADISVGTTDEILEIIDYIKNSMDKRGSDYKIALVAPEELSFGLSRMFASYGSELPLSIGVHRSIDDAYGWIKTEK